MRILGSVGSHGYDEKLLVLQGSDECWFVIIVDRGDDDSLGKVVSASMAGQSGDFMFSSLKKRTGDVRADCAAGLVCLLVPFGGTKAAYTYADDCDSFDGVSEVCWQILSVHGHFGRCQR